MSKYITAKKFAKHIKKLAKSAVNDERLKKIPNALKNILNLLKDLKSSTTRDRIEELMSSIVQEANQAMNYDLIMECLML